MNGLIDHFILETQRAVTGIRLLGLFIALLTTVYAASSAVHVGSDSCSNVEERLTPEDFNHNPPDVFESDGFFKIAMEVSLDYEFLVVQWECNVDNHVVKFNSLMRQSVSL